MQSQKQSKTTITMQSEDKDQTTVSKQAFGVLEDGTTVDAYILRNSRGVTAKVITFGATVVSLHVPDRTGQLRDVVLGYSTLQEYVQHKEYFGCIIGRYANRIAHGQFMIDGSVYQLALNNGPNSLHGGIQGFNRAVWKTISASADADGAKLHLHHVSADGDEGFPGTLKA